MAYLNASTIEKAAIEWMEAIGLQVAHRVDIALVPPLAALRDALLPKLISGELQVKDAERFLVQDMKNHQTGGSHDQEASVHQF